MVSLIYPVTAALSFAFVALVTPAHAQLMDNGRYPITRPEPWLPPPYQSPRGTVQHPIPIEPAPPPRPNAAAPPPPIYVPETGQLLPNRQTISPSGPGGRETFQDRAARCVDQAGAYGSRAGNRNNYIGSCVNQ